MDVIEISGKVAAMLVLGFLGCVFAFGKVLLAQFEKRMDERAKAQDRQAQDAAARVDQRFRAQERQRAEDSARLTALSVQVRDMDRALPLEYVRREDWIRFSAAIDHKLDRLAELVIESKTGGTRARN